MSWIKVLFSVITYAIQHGAEIAAIVTAIWDAIHGVKSDAAHADFVQQLGGGIAHYQVTRDKGVLADLLSRVHQHLAAQ